MVLAALALGAAIALIGVTLAARDVRFIYGVVFGTGIAVLMFLQMSDALAKSATMSPAQAQRYVASRYLIRMSIYAVVLYVSLRAPHIQPLGTILGLLGVKMAVLLLSIAGKAS